MLLRDSAIAAAVLASSCGPALALQVVEASDGVAVEAILSIKEATRIRIDGAPITDVFGNIHSSNCGATTPPPGANPVAAMPAVNPAGELVVECDRDKGEIYVRPVVSAADGARKPVNLFVASAQATYTLLLRHADTPADTIVIRDKAPRFLQPGPDAITGPKGASAHHVRSMKALLLAMASDRVPADIRVDELNQPVQLWAEAKFWLLRRYEGRGLVGERYQLQNISATPMVLTEQEFDRPDSPTTGQVAGVAIEHHNLRPGETTSVYVIRHGGGR